MRAPILIGGLIAAVLFVAACQDDGGEQAPTATATPMPPATLPPPAGGVCQPNPDPRSLAQPLLDTPQPEDEVVSPLRISGQILLYLPTFKTTIFDAEGGTIAEVVSESAELGAVSSFSVELTFSVAESTPACLWVYQESIVNDAPIHVRQVPIVLLP